MLPEKEVEIAIEQFFYAMDTQNLEIMNELVAHDTDMVHIGTDKKEIWRGWHELKKATVEQFEGLEYYKAQIRNLQVTISPSGDAAWYSHLLDARIKSNGKEHVWEGARFTGVFEKQNNRWIMVQSHVSIPEST